MSQEAVAQTGQETIASGRATPIKALQDNLTLFIQLVGLGVALWGPLIVIMIWMTSQFTEIRQDIADMRVDIANLEIRLTAQIQELDTRLTAQIQELDTRLTAQMQESDAKLAAQIQALDNKITAIGDMTLIAFTDGEISSEELAAIWERATVS